MQNENFAAGRPQWYTRSTPLGDIRLPSGNPVHPVVGDRSKMFGFDT
jgi:hypothetical protein